MVFKGLYYFSFELREWVTANYLRWLIGSREFEQGRFLLAHLLHSLKEPIDKQQHTLLQLLNQCPCSIKIYTSFLVIRLKIYHKKNVLYDILLQKLTISLSVEVWHPPPHYFLWVPLQPLGLVPTSTNTKSKNFWKKKNHFTKRINFIKSSFFIYR